MQKFAQFLLKSIQTPYFVINPVELKEYINFEVKRIYYITKPMGPSRPHCHYVEKEFFIMIQGSGTAIIDQGNGLEEFCLQGPRGAIYVPNFVWHGFKDFSDDAILLALSSTNYTPDRSDYLEDYAQYLETPIIPNAQIVQRGDMSLIE
jgi:oxalate decarboxylase/phosphoglucose isomerase-like protein (cupin superfamily)